MGQNNGVTVVIGVVQWTGSCDCEYFVTSIQVTAHRRLADRTVSTTLRQGHRRAAPLSGLPNSAASAVATVLSVDRATGVAACERDNRRPPKNTRSVCTGGSETTIRYTAPACACERANTIENYQCRPSLSNVIQWWTKPPDGGRVICKYYIIA